MKTIDLAEKPVEAVGKSSKKKYYPTIYYSDKGVGGISSFDDQDIGKMMKVQADCKLVGIRSSDEGKGKKFDYTLEVQKLCMPDDLSKQASQAYIDKRRQKKEQMRRNG